MGIISNIRNDLSDVAFIALLESDQFLKVYTSYKQFISHSKYPMFLFWSSYIEIVCLLLKFIRATREGNWSLHLSCIRDMLPWVNDRINCSRYLPMYWCQMKTLSKTHPQAQHYRHAGEFAVQRSQDVSFSQVAVDHTIEQTMNKDTKTKRGIIGFSLNKGAVQRWILTAHEREAILRNFKNMLQITDYIERS